MKQNESIVRTTYVKLYGLIHNREEEAEERRL